MDAGYHAWMMSSLGATIILIGLFLADCACGSERFTLVARLLQPRGAAASPRLVLALHNVSVQPQRVATLTNLFEGRVYLRTVKGEVHEFIQTNYLNLMLTGTWITPTIELGPGRSHRWEHPLSEFVDLHRIRTKCGISFPDLAAEFQLGCEIWCAFDVRQPTIHETTAILISEVLRHQ